MSKYNEVIKGQPIRCYDSGDKFADRFTVLYMNEPEYQPGTFLCLGMSDNPFHPQGVGQHSAAQPGKHLGRRVSFIELPADCQAAVLQDLS